ncbi:MAG: 50S ribosomal protein L14 [Candidatus Diapherotrites archaeon]|nr:50S ribosomal protein L14 [Candidatus Diapherotrites archaeon]
MKAITASATKGLTLRSWCTCADNSGAKEVYIMGVMGSKGRRRMSPKAGIGDIVKVVIKKGKPEMRKKVEKAVVIRVKKEYRRATGERIKFEDNAVVLVDDKGLPKASEIKGVVAKEAAERFPKLAGISAGVV